MKSLAFGRILLLYELNYSSVLCVHVHGNPTESPEIEAFHRGVGYPGYEDIAGCYFLKGYAYENAEKYDEAREAYSYFVENYPDHYLAADTKVMINYIGMNPEEMFDAIMANATDQNLVQE